MATSPQTASPDYFSVRHLQFEQVEDLLKLQKAAQQ